MSCTTGRHLLIAFFLFAVIPTACLAHIPHESTAAVCRADSTSNLPICVNASYSDSLRTSTELQNELMRDKYRRRSRNERLLGGLCLGVGATSTFSYLIVSIFKAFNSNSAHESEFLYRLWGYGSLAVASASIPLLIDSYRNNRKAKKLSGGGSDDANDIDYYRSGWRYELSGGLCTTLEDYGNKRLPGWCIALETRRYLPHSNFDISVQAAFDYNAYRNDMSATSHESALRLAVIADYNFRRLSKYDPFLGIGVGTSLPLTIFIQPRIGLRISTHHSISLTSHIGIGSKERASTDKLTSNICLLYGYTF